MESETFELTLDEVARWCNRRGLTFQRDEPNDRLIIPRAFEKLALVVVFRDDRDLVNFAMTVPVDVPDDRVLPMIRLMNQLNATTFMGAWVLREEPRQLYYRATLPSRTMSLGDHGLDYMTRLVVGTVKGCQDRIRGVVDGTLDPLGRPVEG